MCTKCADLYDVTGILMLMTNWQYCIQNTMPQGNRR